MRLFAAGLALGSSASFASLPVTVGYLRILDFKQGTSADSTVGQVLDSSGNLIVLSSTDGAAYRIWNIQKRDPFGVLIFDTRVLVNGYPPFVRLDSVGNVYAVGTNQGNLGDSDVEFIKLSPSGTPIWASHWDSGSSTEDTPMDGCLDAQGNLRLAVKVSDPAVQFAIVTIAPQGYEPLGSRFTSNVVNPTTGVFAPDGSFLYQGLDSAGSAALRLLDPTNSERKLETIIQTATISGGYAVGVDSQGNFDVAANVTDSSSGTPVRSFTLRSLQTNGNLLSTSGGSGMIVQTSSADPNNVYATIFDGASFRLAKYGTAGAQWSLPLPMFSSLVANGTHGVFIARNQVGHPNVGYLESYDSKGVLNWGATANSSSAFSSMYVMQPVAGNGILHFLGYGIGSGGTSDVITSSYVTGQALATITAPAQLKGGSLVSGAINLNLAGSAFSVKINCSNPNLVAVPGVLQIPAGLKTVAFQGMSAVVDKVTPVTLSATAAGVFRSATIHLLPSALSSLDLANSTVAAGQSTTATVTLDGPTGPHGRIVSLASSDPTIATVPPAVFVPIGAKSVSFTVSTVGGKMGSVTLSASALGVTKSQALTVNP